MKFVKKVLGLSFSFVGCVIGAGFISGREIVSFFSGSDVILNAVTVFLSFFFGFVCVIVNKKFHDNVLFTITQPVILAFDLVMMGGMLSFADSVQIQIMGERFSFPIFSIVFILASNLILAKGNGAIKKVNLYLVPIMILFSVLTCLLKGQPQFISSKILYPNKIFSYVGLNLFCSSLFFIQLSKDESPAVKIMTAVLSSLTLSILILVISSTLFSEDKRIVYSDIPLLDLAGRGGVLFYALALCMTFGAFTTLVSDHLPLFLFVENKKFTVFNRIVLSAAAFLISRLGFYKIVGTVYPLLGVFGGITIAVISILTIFFPKRKLSGTSIPQARKELSYSSLRDPT